MCAREQRELIEVDSRRVELPEGVVESRAERVEVRLPRKGQPAGCERALVRQQTEVVEEEVLSREGRGAGATAEVAAARDRRVQRSADTGERPHGAALVPQPTRQLTRVAQQLVLGSWAFRRLPERRVSEVHQRIRRDLIDPEPAALFEVAQECLRLDERDVDDQVGVHAREVADRRGQCTAVVLGSVGPAEVAQHPIVERLDSEAQIVEPELVQTRDDLFRDVIRHDLDRALVRHVEPLDERADLLEAERWCPTSHVERLEAQP